MFGLPLLMKLQLVFMPCRSQTCSSGDVRSFYLFIAALYKLPQVIQFYVISTFGSLQSNFNSYSNLRISSFLRLSFFFFALILDSAVFLLFPASL